MIKIIYYLFVLTFAFIASKGVCINLPTNDARNLSISSFPQLKLWLRADTGLTLSVDSVVTSWQDLSPSNILFSSPSAAQQPVWRDSANYINNKPTIHFDGVNDALLSQTNLSLGNNKTTILLVAKINVKTFYGHLACYGAGNAGDWNLRLVDNSGRLSLTNAESNNGAGVNAGSPIGITSDLSNEPYTFLLASIDPATSIFTIEENFELKSSASQQFSFAPSNPFSLGYRDGALFANMDLAEIMIFNEELSSAEWDDLKTYLQYRYSHGVTLPQDIYNSYRFCDTTVSVNNNDFTNYKWNNNPNDTLTAITVNTPGTYFVEATDVFGFLSYDSINVFFNTPILVSDTTICNGAVFSANASVAGNYNYSWNDGTLTPTLSTNLAGNYTCTITDSLGCSYVSDTIHVYSDDFALTASLGPDTNLCSGNSIVLTSGAQNAVSYSWSDGSTNTSLVINNTGTYSLNVTNAYGCNAADNINVTIIGVAPVADFFSGIICLNNTVQLMDSTTNSSGTLTNWLWVIDTDSLAIQNPFYTFNSTGNHSVSLVATNDIGC
ncbi:MAG: hypothetical protein H7Y07_16580, partial [Pyrinomonadaceae bacterium]|nr:hypothetical protein [Sphingobacteriaceae bacterium]